MTQRDSEIIAENQKEFGERASLFRWVTPQQAQAAMQERSELLAFLKDRASFGFCDTKVDCAGLSPGCILCGTGGWSCLFVNGICNARCFYCPAEQKYRSKAMTAGIEFENPQDYVDYVERFSIKGVGLSGGEPFLTMDRTISFATRLKRRFGSGLYLWLYTNGMAATEDGLRRLADAGLDEIRFDLTAVGYDTSKASLAVRIIGTVTVEIPAIPEDYERLVRLLTELEELGIRHLNLHQLRVTPYNCGRLMDRGYTFLHGEKVTVLESELTALRLVVQARQAGAGLPVNYCSFAFRERFQAFGQRRRYAALVCRSYEEITRAGFIRRLYIKEGDLNRIESLLQNAGEDKGWTKEASGNGIIIRADLLRQCTGLVPTHVSYQLPILLPAVSYRNPFERITLNRKRSLYVERQTVLAEKKLERAEALKLLELIDSGRQCYLDEKEEELFPYECLRRGLQEYF